VVHIKCAHLLRLDLLVSAQVVPIKTTFHFNPDHLRYTTVTLSNQWLTDGSGQVHDCSVEHCERIECSHVANTTNWN
jgi:hypothetical protein